MLTVPGLFREENRLNSHKYENRLPPEGINISREHPLKEFSALLVAGVLIIIVLVTLLVYASDFIATRIPFRYEVSLAEKATETLGFSTDTFTEDSLSANRQTYLTQLSQRLLENQPLNDNLHLRIHYIDADTINAMATLGGHIFIYGGLFDQLENENALAFVVAHEIGHIAHRDPIKAMGRGFIISFALATFIGANDSEIPDWVTSQSGNITALHFSRSQEAAADTYALTSVQTTYGHVNGVDELFVILQREQDNSLQPEFLQTHPLHQSRLDSIYHFGHHQQAADGAPTPLPTSVKTTPSTDE